MEYASTKDAMTAIARFNESTFGGREIRCREDRPEKTDDASAPAAEKPVPAPRKERVAPEDRVRDPKRIFVGNLPSDVTEESLCAFFSSAGVVKSFTINGSGRRRGRAPGGKSAQIEFENDGSAEIAIADLNGADFDGSAVVVREFYID